MFDKLRNLYSLNVSQVAHQYAHRDIVQYLSDNLDDC